MRMPLTPATCLPHDRARALLVGRVCAAGGSTGRCRCACDGDDVCDLSPWPPTVSQLLELAGPGRGASAPPARCRASARSRRVLANSAADERDAGAPWLLAPCDLQAIKASGVTFVASTLERVIEEQARGDPAKAESVRAAIVAVIGDNLAAHPSRLDRGGRAEGGADPAGRVVAVPRGRHRPRRRDLHQVAADVGGRPRRRDRHPSEIRVEQSRAGDRAGGEQPRADASAPRSATTSTCATSRAAARCCSARRRTTTPPARSGRSSGCSTSASASTTCARASSRCASTGRTASRSTARARCGSSAAIRSISSATRSGRTISTRTASCCSSARCSRRPRTGWRTGQGFTHVVGDIVTVATPTLGALVNRVNHSRQDRAVDVRRRGADAQPRAPRGPRSRIERSRKPGDA